MGREESRVSTNHAPPPPGISGSRARATTRVTRGGLNQSVQLTPRRFPFLGYPPPRLSPFQPFFCSFSFSFFWWSFPFRVHDTHTLSLS